MRTYYFCYSCGSTIQRQDGTYTCYECKISEVVSSAHMTFFNYEMAEFLNPVFLEEEEFWWEESIVHEHGTAIYLVRLPSNVGIVPREKITIVDGFHHFSTITLEEIN